MDEKTKDELKKLAEGKPAEIEQPQEEESGLKKFWNKTIFPDMIKDRKERAEQEKQMKKEVMEELKPEIKEMKKEQIKQQMKDKITGAGRQKKMQKFADAFSFKGTGIGSTESINRLLGTGRDTGVNVNPGQMREPTGVDVNPADLMMGRQQQEEPPRERVRYERTRKKRGKKKAKVKARPQPKPQQTMESFEDKMKRMLS